MNSENIYKHKFNIDDKKVTIKYTSDVENDINDYIIELSEILSNTNYVKKKAYKKTIIYESKNRE